jgi:hypothetical protein
VDADAVDVVVSAVSAGAAAGLKSTVSTAVTDAYAALRRLITDRYAGVDVSAVESKPASAAKRDSLAEDLRDTSVGADAEVASAAQQVLAAVAEHAPEVGPVIGVDLVGLSAANVRLHDITAEGPGAIGLRARDVTASGDFEASRIRATDRPAQPPDPPAR